LVVTEAEITEAVMKLELACKALLKKAG